MNRRIIMLVAVMVCIFSPWVIFSGVKPRANEGEKQLPEQITADTYVENDSEITLLLPDGNLKSVPLELYITNVVLREMPAEFEVEALKAQAVVARTYTLRRLKGNPKHIGAAVCTDPACCQGYCTESEFLENGGTQQNLERVSDAVRSTSGLVLTYENQLIEATYFSCSGGMTEDASAVWGADIPYLKATQSPGEERATHYTDTVKFTLEEFAGKLGLSVTDNLQVEELVLTEGGGVASLTIGEKEFTGTEFRGKLGLNSTAFMISVVGDCVIITTKGFGHRVGMSQYGADAMAVQGSGFAEILQHYYCGTDLVLYGDLD